MSSVSLKLPESLAAKLAAVARKRGQTKSALVRELLEQYFERNSPSSQGSCLDLISDLVGCVDGPRDLSVSDRHMLGYGK
jgi:metal-responsive CopG/Arc/MetJ family transcriptional regulator